MRYHLVCVEGLGTENTVRYRNCRLLHLDIGNIHAMRESIDKLRSAICESTTELHWLSTLEDTQWLKHIATVLTVSWYALCFSRWPLCQCNLSICSSVHLSIHLDLCPSHSLCFSCWVVCSFVQGATTVARWVAEKGTGVLVHCSDGWDRTSQLTSLSQLMLDPHYRTFEGFKVHKWELSAMRPSNLWLLR